MPKELRVVKILTGEKPDEGIYQLMNVYFSVDGIPEAFSHLINVANNREELNRIIREIHQIHAFSKPTIVVKRNLSFVGIE